MLIHALIEKQEKKLCDQRESNTSESIERPANGNTKSSKYHTLQTTRRHQVLWSKFSMLVQTEAHR